jgi:hypothetical protein
MIKDEALRNAIQHIEMQQYGHALDVLYKALENQEKDLKQNVLGHINPEAYRAGEKK